MNFNTKVILGAILATSAVGCGNSINCEILGDNVHGRVNFDGGIGVNSDAQIVVQYSEDSFATIKRSRVVANSQGLLSVPFSFCADSDVDFQLRAFQDDDRDGTWSSGTEGAGRDDNDTAGHNTYATRIVQSSGTGDTSSWEEVKDVSISIDGLTGL